MFQATPHNNPTAAQIPKHQRKMRGGRTAILFAGETVIIQRTAVVTASVRWTGTQKQTRLADCGAPIGSRGSATTTARAIAAEGQCTQSETPREIESPILRPAFQASVADVGIDRRWFVSFGRVDRAPNETRVTQRRQAAKERVQVFAAWRLCVRSFHQVRQRTYQTVLPEAVCRKQRSDKIRWAQFERTNRSRDVRRWTFGEPAVKRLSTNYTNDTNRFAAAHLAFAGSVNELRSIRNIQRHADSSGVRTLSAFTWAGEGDSIRTHPGRGCQRFRRRRTRVGWRGQRPASSHGALVRMPTEAGTDAASRHVARAAPPPHRPLPEFPGRSSSAMCWQRRLDLNGALPISAGARLPGNGASCVR